MNLMIVAKDGTALDVLAERYRTAFNKTKAGRAQWIDGTLELAAVMAEVKRQPELAGSILYNRWLQRNGLQDISPQNRSALNNFSQDLVYARQLLEVSNSVSWEQIWRTRPNKPQCAPSESRKGTPQPLSRRSGSSLRKRAQRIPDVMREDYEPPPVRKAVVLKGLTREQIDPDFKGTATEFATKHGHVTLHTKQEIEHHKHQEALAAWLGAMADHERSARAMLTALAAVDSKALQQWKTKPGKTEKLKSWSRNIELACERIREVLT